MRSQEASAKIRTIILMIMITITMIIIVITIIIYSIHHHHHHSSPLKANLRIFRARPVLACPAHRGAFVIDGHKR